MVVWRPRTSLPRNHFVPGDSSQFRAVALPSLQRYNGGIASLGVWLLAVGGLAVGFWRLAFGGGWVVVAVGCWRLSGWLVAWLAVAVAGWAVGGGGWRGCGRGWVAVGWWLVVLAGAWCVDVAGGCGGW